MCCNTITQNHYKELRDIILRKLQARPQVSDAELYILVFSRYRHLGKDLFAVLNLLSRPQGPLTYYISHGLRFYRLKPSVVRQ